MTVFILAHVFDIPVLNVIEVLVEGQENFFSPSLPADFFQTSDESHLKPQVTTTTFTRRETETFNSLFWRETQNAL